MSADQFLGETSGGWEILYNAIDTEIFIPRKDKLKEDPLILLLGGNQFQYYRVECALKILSFLVKMGVNAKLLVTGRLGWQWRESAAIGQAQKLIKKLNIQGLVDFSGPYSQTNAPLLLQRAHILIHPQINDSCPGLVVEALACGLPVVYSATGGVPELVGSGAGIGVSGKVDWDVLTPPRSSWHG